ncbi:MAG: hypothetical protein WBA74_11355 [Cyclobacteriaceae bacterium]
MGLFSKNFWFKLKRWEYWPFDILYIPVYPYFTWQIIKRRSFFFFTASNPSIDFGGMLGEKKSEIFDLIPEKYLPVTIKLPSGTDAEYVTDLMTDHHLTYPVILKPDIGERGWMVRKINSDRELQSYLDEVQVDFLLQEFVDLPLELGVFYYRFPDEQEGRVSSIVAKEMLYITGDGHQTVLQLIENKPRARFQLDALKAAYDEDFLKKTLPAGERLELVSIGNHCKGTKFLDGNSWIDSSLNKAVDTLAKSIPDFYFGRFDLRCSSIEELRELKNFKIMELNGAGAEPAHIYQPGYSLLKAYRAIYHHIRVLSKISFLNKKRGISYWSTAQGLTKIKEIKAYNRQKSTP